ncbi:MAG: DNA helicase RecQ [Crocinitomicaceae bacterium]|jgi:ATP-dependent DNA helicase RecQ|nr:DNA helicase RecQ [Crocinitomicaceae bacterium]
MPLNLESQLKKYFGYDHFRPQQKEIIETILAEKDTLALMPTGAGKSICFQLPALLKKGTTLVISPLISLMEDQVQSLKSNGIEAQFYNSTMSAEEKQLLKADLQDEKIKLLYVAPETLFNEHEDFLHNHPFELIVVDEAHCVSMWGHDFRPEYKKIHRLREKFSQSTFVAFTATADKLTRKDIAESIGLKSPEVFISSFDRPNIALNVAGNLPKKKRLEEIVRFIKERKDQSGIIYCLSRKETEEIAAHLKGFQISAGVYHAGLNSDIRSRTQQAFINDEVQIICATIAFGMGIDKSNVRWVIHANLPKNMEGYYQEIGRAGRDGLPSEALLFYTLRDVKLLSDFAKQGGQSEVLLEKLNRMLSFAESRTCRRTTLLSYFSENHNGHCGNCDNCQFPPKYQDGTILAQMALSAVKRCSETLSTLQVIDVLRGAKTVEVFEKGWDKVKTYGVGANHSWKDWAHFLTEFKNLGLFEVAYDDHMRLKITPEGDQVLKGSQKIQVTLPEVHQTTKQVQTKELTVDELLFDRLRLVRKKLASQENVPPYLIFSDAHLKDMAAKAPRNKEEFLLVSGVGEVKLEKYGSIFLDAILNFQSKQGSGEKKASTFDQTLQYFNLGQSISEIAKNRELSETTIASHLAQLIKEQKITSYERLIKTESIELVAQAVDKLTPNLPLKPIYEQLNGELDYGTIRLALSILETQQEATAE